LLARCIDTLAVAAGNHAELAAPAPIVQVSSINHR
jgi:hypothetical protein